MSNISKNSGANVGIELNSITVDSRKERGECWKFNISNQFPIIPPNIEKGGAVIDIDSPHKGYSIQTVMETGKMNGESIIFNPDHIQIASLVFVDGVANGPCKLYDEEGTIFFEGCFVNGCRHGKGKEYDKNGNVMFEGFYEEGKRMNIVELKEMKGYWKEMNDANEIISICQKDEEGNNDGICYFYSNGKIDKVSEWKNGKELNVLKRFEGKRMIEFVNGVKRYEGEYRDSIKYNYPREGEGKEYDTDGETVLYQGQYWNGRRHGQGKAYKDRKKVYDGMWIWGYRLDRVTWICIIIMIILVLISFISLFYAGIAILVVDVIFWTVLWFYSPSIQSILYHSINRNGKTSQIKKDLESTKQLNILSLCFLLVVLINVLFAIIPLLVLINLNSSTQNVKEYCLGYSTGSSLVIDSNSCKDNNIVSFNPSTNVILESIEIGDDCFENVNEFLISGLNELKSLKIGINSFTKQRNGKIIRDSNQSFSILNCIELESIEIGEYSFSDYSGGFELINLPKLSSIKIGDAGNWSSNFFNSSFEIKGMTNVILLMNRSS